MASQRATGNRASFTQIKKTLHKAAGGGGSPLKRENNQTLIMFQCSYRKTFMKYL